MNLNWFKRIGIIYVPKSVFGWVIFLSCLGYSVFKFIDIDSRSHSVSDTLMNFVFNLLIIWAVYTLVAFLISVLSKKEE